MTHPGNNYAFIDSQNVNLGVRGAGWKLDFKRFRVYLLEKYGVQKAFLFLGYISEQKSMYSDLQSFGYVLVFKPVILDKDGLAKGNCDAELVLQAMADYQSYDQAVIATGDGDFYCLAKYLIERDKLKALLIPNRSKFSALLKIKMMKPYLRFMNDLEQRLAYKKKKAP